MVDATVEEPILSNNRQRQMTSWVAKLKATYSASVEDLATVFCFRLDQLTSEFPMKNVYPDVERRVSMSPAQSESEYPNSASLPSEENSNP